MMPLNIYTHMATPEEIRKKNLEASNEALSESINLASQLNDKMAFLYKMSKEKFTQDKLSLDLTKQTVTLTKNLSSQYDSIKQVEKDIAKNKKLQNDIARQQLSLEKVIGEEGKRRIQYVQGREKSLTRSNEILKQLREKEAAGVAGAKEQANRLAQQVLARKEALNIQMQNLTFEEKQYMMLQESSGVLEENNEYLAEQLRLQNNLAKSQGLITSALGGANSAMKKIGLGGLADKLGLEAATKKSQEMIYELTNGGQKTLGIFGKLRVGVASFGVALKSALGPLALIGIAVSLFNKFKEIGIESANALKAIDQNTQNLGRSLGVSNKIASQVAENARSIGSAIGVASEVAISSAQSIYSALDGAEKVNQKTLDTFMKLNVFAGMSAESLAGMYRFAKLTGESAADVAESIATTARESIISMKVNVSMKQVMEGVAKTSNIIKLSFKGSAEELTKAFVSSKKLGLELQKVDDIAGSLLNFEDSIAAEMEAELLSGKDLNLEKAREAALLGDNAKLMEEIKQSGIDQLFLNAKTRPEQVAIAKALGMSRESMADMVSDAIANEAINTELVDTQAQSLAAMQSIASIAERQLAAEEAKNLAAAKTGEQMIKFQNLMYSIQTAGLKILDNVFGPIGEGATGILESVSDWLGKTENIEMISNKIKTVVDGIKYAFGEVYGFVQPIVAKLGELGLVLLPVIQNLWETIKPTVMNIKDFIGEILGSITSLIEKLTTGNGEFTTMEKIVGAIGIALIAIKATMMGINAYKSIMIAYERTSESLAKGKLAIEKFTSNEYVKQAGQMVKNAALAAKDFLKATGSAVMKVISSLASIPIVGVALGIAAAAGVAALAYKYMSDGVISPSTGGSGFGDRVLLGPEGAISFNNKDTIVAGTSLFKGDDVVSSPAGSVGMGNTAILETLLERLIGSVEKGSTIVLDGKKVGESLVLGAYRIQ